MPNYYGPQRFGRDGETLHLGLALLRGEEDDPQSVPEKARPVRGPIGSVQSYLAQRLRDGLLRRSCPATSCARSRSAACSSPRTSRQSRSRFDAREIVTAGPIFGRKTFAAEADAAQREQAALSAFGLTETSFNGFGKLLQGTRRHNLVYLDDLAADVEPDGVRLSFTLPAGSYATVLLREIMKGRGAA